MSDGLALVRFDAVESAPANSSSTIADLYSMKFRLSSIFEHIVRINVTIRDECESRKCEIKFYIANFTVQMGVYWVCSRTKTYLSYMSFEILEERQDWDREDDREQGSGECRRRRCSNECGRSRSRGIGGRIGDGRARNVSRRSSEASVARDVSTAAGKCVAGGSVGNHYR